MSKPGGPGQEWVYVPDKALLREWRRKWGDRQLQQFRVHTSSIPDWVRRGIRLFIALFLFGLLGHGLWAPPGFPKAYLDELVRSSAWAGVTCIMLTAPLIGRVAQTSTERALGTILGGSLGFIAYDYGRSIFPDAKIDDLFLSSAAAIVGMLSCFMAHALGLDMTPRFFAMTFILVTSGAPSYGSGYLVAAVRTGGILAGVLVLAILVLPRSASIEALRDLGKSLKHIRELNALVWACNDLTAPPHPHPPTPPGKAIPAPHHAAAGSGHPPGSGPLEQGGPAAGLNPAAGAGGARGWGGGQGGCRRGPGPGAASPPQTQGGPPPPPPLQPPPTQGGRPSLAQWQWPAAHEQSPSSCVSREGSFAAGLAKRGAGQRGEEGGQAAGGSSSSLGWGRQGGEAGGGGLMQPLLEGMNEEEGAAVTQPPSPLWQQEGGWRRMEVAQQLALTLTNQQQQQGQQGQRGLGASSSFGFLPPPLPPALPSPSFSPLPSTSPSTSPSPTTPPPHLLDLEGAGVAPGVGSHPSSAHGSHTHHTIGSFSHLLAACPPNTQATATTTTALPPLPPGRGPAAGESKSPRGGGSEDAYLSPPSPSPPHPASTPSTDPYRRGAQRAHPHLPPTTFISRRRPGSSSSSSSSSSGRRPGSGSKRMKGSGLIFGQCGPRLQRSSSSPRGSGCKGWGSGGGAGLGGVEGGSGDVSQGSGSDSSGARQRVHACEKALAGIYTRLATCEDNVKCASGEFYLWHFWGHYIFLPSIPSLGRLYAQHKERPALRGAWFLSPARVAAVADSIRRLSRLLWNVHLSLADDFDPAFKALLATHYPPDLLPHLASSFAAAIEALITAFPKNRVIAVDHLHAVAAAVKTLQATSDKRHRRAMRTLRRASYFVGPASGGYTPQGGFDSGGLTPVDVQHFADAWIGGAAASGSFDPRRDSLFDGRQGWQIAEGEECGDSERGASEGAPHFSYNRDSVTSAVAGRRPPDESDSKLRPCAPVEDGHVIVRMEGPDAAGPPTSHQPAAIVAAVPQAALLPDQAAMAAPFGEVGANACVGTGKAATIAASAAEPGAEAGAGAGAGAASAVAPGAALCAHRFVVSGTSASALTQAAQAAEAMQVAPSPSPAALPHTAADLVGGAEAVARSGPAPGVAAGLEQERQVRAGQVLGVGPVPSPLPPAPPHHGAPVPLSPTCPPPPCPPPPRPAPSRAASRTYRSASHAPSTTPHLLAAALLAARTASALSHTSGSTLPPGPPHASAGGEGGGWWGGGRVKAGEGERGLLTGPSLHRSQCGKGGPGEGPLTFAPFVMRSSVTGSLQPACIPSATAVLLSAGSGAGLPLAAWGLGGQVGGRRGPGDFSVRLPRESHSMHGPRRSLDVLKWEGRSVRCSVRERGGGPWGHHMSPMNQLAARPQAEQGQGQGQVFGSAGGQQVTSGLPLPPLLALGVGAPALPPPALQPYLSLPHPGGGAPDPCFLSAYSLPAGESLGAGGIQQPRGLQGSWAPARSAAGQPPPQPSNAAHEGDESGAAGLTHPPSPLPLPALPATSPASAPLTAAPLPSYPLASSLHSTAPSSPTPTSPSSPAATAPSSPTPCPSFPAATAPSSPFLTTDLEVRARSMRPAADQPTSTHTSSWEVPATTGPSPHPSPAAPHTPAASAWHQAGQGGGCGQSPPPPAPPRPHPPPTSPTDRCWQAGEHAAWAPPVAPSQAASPPPLEPLEPHLIFPSTPEGHISQVRWYGFEFLMDELADELEELYVAISALMATLPHPL
ncbi:hypothetical protein V8C86DRAFT_3190339 [Haematococcus lacustris]